VGQSSAATRAPGGSPFSGCHGFSYLAPHTQSLLSLDASRAEPAPGRPGIFRQMIPAGMGGGGGGMGTLQALLTELSGLKKPRGFFNRIVRRTLGMKPKAPPKYRILVIMATNLPSALDEALLRPGRIDRIYRVGYPSKEGRRRTYEGYFAKVRNEVSPDQIEHLATITPYATGATIKDLVNESLIVALRDGREVITWPDVLRAKLSKSVGPSEGVEYIERERHAVAVHEACHAVISHLAQKRNVIDTATIEKGANYLGFVKPIPIEEQFTSPRWSGSGCSSTAIPAPACPVICRPRPRSRWRWRACGAWAASTAPTPRPGRHSTRTPWWTAMTGTCWRRPWVGGSRST
jgi:hypothetical protein